MRLSLVSVFVVASLASACRPNAEQKQSAAARATAEAEERASQTTITSGVVDDAADASITGDDDAIRAKAEAIAAFRSEEAEYRGKLQAEIDRLDHRIGESKKKGRSAPVPRDLETRREILLKDLASIDRSTEQDWATLRPKLDRDLTTTPDFVRPRSDRPWGQ